MKHVCKVSIQAYFPGLRVLFRVGELNKTFVKPSHLAKIPLILYEIITLKEKSP